jgi:hypothetical protein
MKYTDLVENNYDDENIVLYHGTSEPAEKIKRIGLIAAGNHQAVFLTDNPELAIHYAETDQERTNNDYITLVTVNSKDLTQSLLTGDADHINIEDWRESLRKEDQCMYLGNIDPNILKVEEL